MSDLKEKAAYMRGLLEGMEFNQNSREKILWEGMINFCNEVAENLHDFKETHEEFAEYVEAIDEDLGVLEKYFYNTNEEAEEESDVISNEDGDTVIEMECPNCKEELYFTDEAGNYEVLCPECGETVWNHFVEDNPTHTQSSDDVI